MIKTKHSELKKNLYKNSLNYYIYKSYDATNRNWNSCTKYYAT